MKSKWLSSILIVFVATILLFSSSCAALREQSLYSNYIESQVANYEYTTSFSRVWNEAHRLLLNEGYRVENSRSRNTLTTNWRKSGDDTQVRYIVIGQDFSDGHCAVTFQREVARNTYYHPDAYYDPARHGQFTTGKNNPPPPPISTSSRDDRYGARYDKHDSYYYDDRPVPNDGYSSFAISTERDYDMEIKLIQRVEPQNMVQIRREASEYAKKAVQK